MKNFEANDKKLERVKYRYFFIYLCLAIFLLCLLFQFGSFMLSPKEEVTPLPTYNKVRGSINDRNGNLLALQTTLYNLSATKGQISDIYIYASVLSPALDMSENEIIEKFNSSKSQFLYLKKKLTESQKNIVSDVIKEHKLSGLRLEEVVNRTYPENKLASTLIGFLGDDGYGLAGIEYSAQSVLSPPENTEGYNGKGYNVFLTIDNNIQYTMQKNAEKAMQDWKAESVIFLAVDAKTGEILGYVSEPSADLASFTKSSPDQLVDRPAMYTYEPGSVFKIFSVASLLELAPHSHDEIYECNGTYSFNKNSLAPITCQTPHGLVDAEGIIQHSCNVGISQMSENVSNKDFYEKLKEFGFGQKTGIELPGETSGLFAQYENWSARSKPTIAMGQELGVSALQIVEAATCFANDGKRLDLSLISKITDSDDKILYVHKSKVENTPISSETAHALLEYMKAEEGIGYRAAVSGVQLSVKTGTAQMALSTGRGYSKTDYVASCIALFPQENPQVILYLAVIKPQGSIYGSVVAAPIISNVANDIIEYYGLTRSGTINIQHSGLISTENGKKIILSDTMPNLIGLSKKELQSLFDKEINPQNYKVLINGEGYVYEQFPLPGEILEEGTKIELNLR